MKRRPLAPAAIVLALLVGSAAHAGPADGTAIAVASDFDLTRRETGDGAGRRFRLGSPDDRLRFPDERNGPYWSYSPVSGGPKIEAGALGAGRKGAPRLAHVGVDWSF